MHEVVKVSMTLYLPLYSHCKEDLKDQMFNHLVKLTLVILLLTNQATSQRVIIKVGMIIPQPILVCWLVHAG